MYDIMLIGECLFCFFKQKTAYEMRISDWSSDVGSSDLGQPGGERDILGQDGRVRRNEGNVVVGKCFSLDAQHGSAGGVKHGIVSRMGGDPEGLAPCRSPAGAASAASSFWTRPGNPKACG